MGICLVNASTLCVRTILAEEYEMVLKEKTPKMLWTEDLNGFMEELEVRTAC